MQQDFGNPILDFIVLAPLEVCEKIIQENLTHQLWQTYASVTRKNITITPLDLNSHSFTIAINQNRTEVRLRGFLNYIDANKTRVVLGKSETSIKTKSFFILLFGIGGMCSLLSYFPSGEIKGPIGFQNSV